MHIFRSTRPKLKLDIITRKSVDIWKFIGQFIKSHQIDIYFWIRLSTEDKYSTFFLPEGVLIQIKINICEG